MKPSVFLSGSDKSLQIGKLAISKRHQILLKKFQVEGTVWVSQVVLVVKNPPANAGDIKGAGSIPGLGRPPGKGNGYPLQYFFLENSMEKGAWWATIHGVSKSQTQLRD